MSENETTQVLEPTKPSKMDRVKGTAFIVSIYAMPIAIAGASMYVTTKNARLAYETAKLNLETARLNAQS